MNDVERKLSELLTVGNADEIKNVIADNADKVINSAYEFIQILVGGNYDNPQSLMDVARDAFKFK